MVRRLAIAALVIFLPLSDAAHASGRVPRKTLAQEAEYLDSMVVKGVGGFTYYENWYQHRTTKEVYSCSVLNIERRGDVGDVDSECGVLSQLAPDDSRSDALAVAKQFNAHAYDVRLSLTYVLDRDPPFAQIIYFYLLVDKNKNVTTCRFIQTNYEFSYLNDDRVEIFIQSDKESLSTMKCKQVSK